MQATRSNNELHENVDLTTHTRLQLRLIRVCSNLLSAAGLYINSGHRNISRATLAENTLEKTRVPQSRQSFPSLSTSPEKPSCLASISPTPFTQTRPVHDRICSYVVKRTCSRYPGHPCASSAAVSLLVAATARQRKQSNAKLVFENIEWSTVPPVDGLSRRRVAAVRRRCDAAPEHPRAARRKPRRDFGGTLRGRLRGKTGGAVRSCGRTCDAANDGNS